MKILAEIKQSDFVSDSSCNFYGSKYLIERQVKIVLVRSGLLIASVVIPPDIKIYTFPGDYLNSCELISHKIEKTLLEQTCAYYRIVDELGMVISCSLLPQLRTSKMVVTYSYLAVLIGFCSDRPPDDRYHLNWVDAHNLSKKFSISSKDKLPYKMAKARDACILTEAENKFSLAENYLVKL